MKITDTIKVYRLTLAERWLRFRIARAEKKRRKRLGLAK